MSNASDAFRARAKARRQANETAAVRDEVHGLYRDAMRRKQRVSGVYRDAHGHPEAEQLLAAFAAMEAAEHVISNAERWLDSAYSLANDRASS